MTVPRVLRADVRSLVDSARDEGLDDRVERLREGLGAFLRRQNCADEHTRGPLVHKSELIRFH